MQTDSPIDLQLAYKKVFESPDGTAVLLDLCDRSGLTKFHPDASHEALLVQKGSQRLVFGILTILNTDPKILLERMNRNTTKNYEHSTHD